MQARGADDPDDGADERDRHRVGAHAVARDAASGVDALKRLGT